MRLPQHRRPTPPREVFLEEFLVPLGITQKDAAERLRMSYPRMNEIVKGKRDTRKSACGWHSAKALGGDATWYPPRGTECGSCVNAVRREEARREAAGQHPISSFAPPGRIPDWSCTWRCEAMGVMAPPSMATGSDSGWAPPRMPSVVELSSWST
jgi:hypothetical protein